MKDSEGQKLLEEMCPSLVKNDQGKVILFFLFLTIYFPKRVFSYFVYVADCVDFLNL